MTTVTNLGFPRIGAKRELKRALEAFWSGESSAQSLQDTASGLRERHWQLQREAGVDVPPSNDFSFYDQVLDAAFLFDAIPARYRALADAEPLAGYFAMARGVQRDGYDLHALEMTKWFDTNYHYLVPELQAGQGFALRGDKPLAEYRQAKALGIETRPVLIGPVTFLLLSKTTDGSRALDLLDALLPVYVQLLGQLKDAGAQWVQLDEPALVQDLDEATRAAFTHAYAVLAEAARPKVLVATYFGALDDNLPLAASLPVDGLHVDLVRAPEQLDAVIKALPPGRVLSAGLVNGRNIWRTHPDNALVLARYAHGHVGSDALWLAPSCSLLHSPVDLDLEKKLDDELHSWLAFSRQKLQELRVLADAIDSPARAEDALAHSRACIESRRRSPRVHKAAVAARLAALTAADAQRHSPYPQRHLAQAGALQLPRFPTTTIGSFRRPWKYARPRQQQVRQAVRRRLRCVPGHPDRTLRTRAGADRAGRAGARRVRAQRHGGVLRRAAGRLRVYQERLGAELWLALREAAGDLRRRDPPAADDGALVAVRAVADRPPDEGHADRPGDGAAVVVRAR